MKLKLRKKQQKHKNLQESIDKHATYKVNVDYKHKEVEMKEEELEPYFIKFKPAPKFKEPVIPITQTTAQILREEYTFQKFDDEEKERLRMKEIMGKDDSEFNRWRAEME